jgi:mRNA interferase MazF
VVYPLNVVIIKFQFNTAKLIIRRLYLKLCRRERGLVMAYIPDRSDAVWLDFQSQSGHEQTGRRPAIVLSPDEYNRKVGLAIFCPITKSIKGYPFEVIIPEGFGLTGVILADQVKSMDWKTRNAKLIVKLPVSVQIEVRNKLKTLI